MNGQIEKRLEQLERQIKQKMKSINITLITGVIIVSSEKEIPQNFRGTAIIDDIS